MFKTIGNFDVLKTIISSYKSSSYIKLIAALLVLTSILSLTRCANPVSPTGGPKDIDPPKIIYCNPPNYSVNFNSQKIEIKFDEFIQVKDAANQVVISPPSISNPDFKLRGKSLLIKFEDSLLANTTYSIDFGNAIADIAESNILKDFNYVFSTGPFLDSLSIKGIILDAFDLSPQKEILVMLYKDNNDTIPFDSLPCLVKPYYLTRTKESGEFSLKNLSSGEYKFLALKDLNNDFMYNLPDEKVAFLDTLVYGKYEPEIINDTILSDSLRIEDSIANLNKQLKHDSLLAVDSIVKPDSTQQPPPELQRITGKLFQSFDSIQKLLKYSVVQEGELQLCFRYPLKKLELYPLNLSGQMDWCLKEFSRKQDTVVLWLNHLNVDTLQLQVCERDSVIDTLVFNLKEKTKTKKSDDKTPQPRKPLSISSNVKNGNLYQFKTDPIFTFAFPLTKWDLSHILLVDLKDTIHPKVTLNDSIHRSIKVAFKWQEDKTYLIIFPDSCFFSINDLANDSLKVSFKTSQERDYGSVKLSVNMDAHPGTYIIQLVDEKNVPVAQQTINSSTKIHFNYISPRKYRIKAILDSNKNGQWDTGNYFTKLQPENVFFYPKLLEVRANWEFEEVWEL